MVFKLNARITTIILALFISGQIGIGTDHPKDAMRVYDLKWCAYYKLVPDSLLTDSPRIHKALTVTKDIVRAAYQ